MVGGMATPTALKTLLHVPRHWDRRAKRLRNVSMKMRHGGEKITLAYFVSQAG
jgi:hypothetical protein